MNYSAYYQLKKPERYEQFNIDHWNGNTDTIDTRMHTNQVNIATNTSNISSILANLTSNKSSDSSSTFYKLMALIYPVGSIYWSSKSTNPSTLFGGTWVQIKDKFIWAKGDSDTVNATGGAKTVSLTVANIPAHTHSFTPAGSVSAHAHGLNNHTHSFTPAGSVSAHAHGLNNHTHSFTPSGTVSAHAHGLNNHTHSFVGSSSHNHKVLYSNHTSSAMTYFFGGQPKGQSGIRPSNSHGFEVYNDSGRYITDSATVTISGTTGGNSGNTANATPTFTGKAGTTGGNTGNTANATPTFTGTAGTTGGNSGNTANATPTFTGTAGTTGSTGSTTAHNNMPPYIIKYCWERTA